MIMHEGQLEIGSDLVRRLLAEQFPDWAGLSITRVPSLGTVNALFRLGDELSVRLPLMPHHGDDLARELRWLPFLAPRLPLRVPRAAAAGTPTPEFPHVWAVYEWIAGSPYDDAVITDEAAAGAELAEFVIALHETPVAADVPPAGRRPLAELDQDTRRAITQSDPEIDTRAAMRAWDRALELPPYPGPRQWIHADLLRPNLLVDRGRIAAVIDFGGTGAGDPALDLIAGWATFGPKGRAAFAERLQPAVEDWERARGYALHQAALIIPYYRITNPGFVVLAARTIEQLLAD
ncbi:aminoglycoside phosphotransferase (APT) family kinase protein [Microlunatus parietis]|uniref:Aminoglycoside phosphotransferase (APT) family kinase protein n=2 Tax=Microlunatus parietis TaxID=682979 RepID=A0A7Y9LD61_9ACTN|nr:aminoglycoside phosphotransferase (APT) family kinase protein [Microlunatus parietis]